MKKKKVDFTISSLGESMVQSPIVLSKKKSDYSASYVGDDQRIHYDIETGAQPAERSSGQGELLERAGPREKIYFDPTKVHAGIVKSKIHSHFIYSCFSIAFDCGPRTGRTAFSQTKRASQ